MAADHFRVATTIETARCLMNGARGALNDLTRKDPEDVLDVSIQGIDCRVTDLSEELEALVEAVRGLREWLARHATAASGTTKLEC